MDIRVRTLTPLWTGGVDGGMDRIHETGILGSLRRWYEAIVRGLGGWACDPGRHECPDEDGNYCDVCRVFGATGHRRRFRLEVVDEDTKPLWTPPDRMLNIRPPGRKRGWYLPPGRMGRLTLRLAGDDEALSLLAALFLFLERWGSIGAKPQLGYGVFGIENRDEVLAWAIGEGEERPGWEWQVLGKRPIRATLPDLRRFGFFGYRFRPERPGWWTRVPGIERVASQVQPLVSQYKIVPVSPGLKNEWRFHRWQGSRQGERAVFGSLRPERRRSTVATSWAYRTSPGWEVRGRAWLFSERWADRVWRIVTDPDNWTRVIKVPGDLDARRLQTPEQVQKFLEETR